MSLLVDIGSLLADCVGSPAMTLMGRHEFDGAVAVPVVVPVHKGRHPIAGLVLAGKGPAGVVGPVFDRSEQGFRGSRPREWCKSLGTSTPA